MEPKVISPPDSQKQSPPVVLITGSSGLLGAALVRALGSGYELIGFDRFGDPHPPREAECVCVDIADERSLEHAAQRLRYGYGDRIASVVHLAAYYDFSGEPSDKYEQVTVRGTERLLRALEGFEVKQFIFSSSMLVHRPTEPGRPIDEQWPLEGKWAYPQSKIDAERTIHEKRRKIPAVFLRIAGVYTDTCDSIPIAHQIQRIYEDQLTGKVFPGDVTRGQTFVHLDDVIDAIRRCIERCQELPQETAILIGEPETFSYDRIQRTIAELIHRNGDWETRQVPKAVAKTGAWVQDAIPGLEEPFIKPWMVDLADDHYELNIARAERLLDWHPRHRLIDTIALMVRALKADPPGWYKRHDLGEPPPGARPEIRTLPVDVQTAAQHRWGPNPALKG